MSRVSSSILVQKYLVQKEASAQIDTPSKSESEQTTNILIGSEENLCVPVCQNGGLCLPDTDNEVRGEGSPRYTRGRTRSTSRC